MSDILPCPFCGDRLVQRHAGWLDHPISNCVLSERAFPAFHRGWIGQWNRRADLPRPQDAARIAELEAENAQLLSEMKGGSFYQEKDIDRMQDRIAELEAENDRLRGLLQECADDLRSYVDNEYPETMRAQYPSMQRRWIRDMELVFRVRAALAADSGAEKQKE